MSILGMIGFEAQDEARDKLTILDGSFSYSTDTPPLSASTRSGSGSGMDFVYPWFSGDGTTFNEPSGTNYWLHFQFLPAINGAQNANLIMGVGRSGTEVIAVSAENNTNFLTIRVNGAVVATASTDALSIGTWKRIMVSVDQQSGGLINVYTDGDLTTAVVSHTITAPEAAAFPGNVNEFFYENQSSGAVRFDDFFALDPDDATGTVDINDLVSASIKPQVFTGDGADTGWTGTFADIDELPASDSDQITVGAIDTRSSFTKPALAEDLVFCVKLTARMTRTGTDAGVNMEFYQKESALNVDSGTQAAPADGDNTAMFQVQRDGTAWNTADYDNHEFGVVSRT